MHMAPMYWIFVEDLFAIVIKKSLLRSTEMEERKQTNKKILKIASAAFYSCFVTRVSNTFQM